LLREGKFEEAAKCHETVADLLAEAHEQLESSLIHVHASTLSSQDTSKFLTPVHSFVTLESLSLQRDHHKRQAAVVRYIIFIHFYSFQLNFLYHASLSFLFMFEEKKRNTYTLPKIQLIRPDYFQIIYFT